MKFITIVGARPQFIKAAALSHFFKTQDDNIEDIIIHTGQHYDENMSDIFFTQLGIPKPKYTLKCGGLSHAAMTGRAMEEIEKILLEEKPDYVIVYGDTNATLAGALAASKIHTPVIHIEAGIRSFDRRMPEEINRILTDNIAQFLFTPSPAGQENLEKEGFPHFPNQQIINVGDIQHDSALLFSQKENMVLPEVKDLALKKKPFFFLTMHRPSNVDFKERLVTLMSFLKEMTASHRIIFPIHPRTQAQVEKFGIDTSFLNVIPPTSYIDTLFLVKNSKGVITDSGGLQKEAYYLNQKTLVLRENTEWVELLDHKISKLYSEGLETAEALEHLLSSISENFAFYGQGNTCEKIYQHITNT